MEYLVIYEKSKTGYAAYVPDLPGCIASADSQRAAKEMIKEAIRFHIDGMKMDGIPVPKPTATMAETVAV